MYPIGFFEEKEAKNAKPTQVKHQEYVTDLDPKLGLDNIPKYIDLPLLP